MNEKETNQYKLKIALITDKNIELQQRIDKAIEYINETIFNYNTKDTKKLLEILGDTKEEAKKYIIENIDWLLSNDYGNWGKKNGCFIVEKIELLGEQE